MERIDGRDLEDGPVGTAREARLLVSCLSCEKLHGPERPNDFNPICFACATRSAIMQALEMNGSYRLSDEAIDEVLTRTSPGNYALGYMDGATFAVFYVGRSDSDVRRRLHDWVGTPSQHDRYAPAAKAAWASGPRGLMPLGRPALGRVGVAVDSSYTHFAYSYAPSAEAAFETECRNYDHFGGSGELDNECPPARTARSSWEQEQAPSRP